MLGFPPSLCCILESHSWPPFCLVGILFSFQRLKLNIKSLTKADTLFGFCQSYSKLHAQYCLRLYIRHAKNYYMHRVFYYRHTDSKSPLQHHEKQHRSEVLQRDAVNFSSINSCLNCGPMVCFVLLAELYATSLKPSQHLQFGKFIC